MWLWLPNTASYRRGRLFLLSAVLYQTLSITFRLAFDIQFEGWWLGADILADGILLADMWVGMHTAYAKQGRLIDDPKLMRKHYWRSRGLSELFTVIPFDYIRFLIPLSPFWTAVLRLNRLVRWTTMGSVFPLAGLLGVRNLTLLRIIKLLMAITLTAHVVGCGFYFLAANSSFEHTWLHEEGIASADLSLHYLYSLYWAVTTMTTVGYGDIVPTNAHEIMYTIFAMLLGVSMWAYVIGTIANMVANREGKTTLYRDKIRSINQYLEYYEVPEHLQDRIREYYDHLWIRKRAWQGQEALDDLSASLRTEVGLHLNKDLIDKVPLFQVASHGFKRTLASCLRPSIFAPCDVVAYRGEIGREMYFLTSGYVDVIDEDSGEVVFTHGPGSFFGEIALLRCERRTHTLRAKSYCDVAILSKEDFEHVTECYPEFTATVHAVAQRRRDEPPPS